MIIVNVDYRLAPEFPFPTQVWDSWAALKWVFANASMLGIDPSRVSVGGLSAGAHLSAVLALLARDEPSIPPLKLQLLVVPALDCRWTPIEGSCDPNVVPYETYITCEYAPCLPLNRMRWFSNLWLGTDPGKDNPQIVSLCLYYLAEERKRKTNMWIASPVVAESHANLARASIHCAEFDVLRSEAQVYHEKLLRAGTESAIKIYKGVAHPFGHWDGELEIAKEYVKDTLDALRAAHSP